MTATPIPLDWHRVSIHNDLRQTAPANALLISQDGDLAAIGQPDIEHLENGFTLTLDGPQGARFQVGSDQAPLPFDLLGNPRGLAIFLVNDAGDSVDGIKMFCNCPRCQQAKQKAAPAT